ncbi:MAG: transketolase C-terminal domain-containing protein, partial [Bacilli bacterium]
ALVALGPMVAIADNAALMLAKHGVSARVINMRFVKPLDEGLLRELAAERAPIVTIEEGSLKGGMGSAILEFYAAQAITQAVHPLGLPDRFVEHGSRPELLHHVGLTSEHIAEVALLSLDRTLNAKQGRRTVGR